MACIDLVHDIWIEMEFTPAVLEKEFIVLTTFKTKANEIAWCPMVVAGQHCYVLPNLDIT